MGMDTFYIRTSSFIVTCTHFDAILSSFHSNFTFLGHLTTLVSLVTFTKNIIDLLFKPTLTQKPRDVSTLSVSTKMSQLKVSPPCDSTMCLYTGFL